MEQKFRNPIVFAVAVIVVAVIAPLRSSMLDGLVAGLGVVVLGILWIMLSDRASRKGTGAVQLLLIALMCLLGIVGFLLRNVVGEWLFNAAGVLMFIYALVPAIRRWLDKRKATL